MGGTEPVEMGGAEAVGGGAEPVEMGGAETVGGGAEPVEMGGAEPVEMGEAAAVVTGGGDRTAIVTGGTGGLGAAVTKAFLDGGWRVVVPWVAERELTRVERRDGLELVQADLFDETAVAEVAREAGDGVRAVVNLVGGFAEHGRIHETPVDTFDEQLRLNLRPAYLVTAAALPAMLAAGEGAVVCVSSRAALRPFPGAAGYIVAKRAVLGLVDVLDAEYRNDGIRANAILPSVIDTPANRASMPDADFDRWVRPDEIAQVVRFLCEPGATPTSGAHLPVYGRA